MQPHWLETSVDPDDPRAWEIIWRWRWFARDCRPSFRAEVGDWAAAVAKVLARFRPRSVHDAACGMGYKTILLAEQGYELSGSDPCAFAIERARELARAEGHAIPYDLGSLADLAAGGPRYDCVHTDSFDQLEGRALLERSAAAAGAALRPGGLFVFGALPDRSRDELAQAMESEWRRQQRFVAFPACSRDGTTLRELHVFDRLPDGVLQNRIYWIEEEGANLRLETSSWLVRARWTRDDYRQVLEGAGFRSLETFVEQGTGSAPIVFHAAFK